MQSLLFLLQNQIPLIDTALLLPEDSRGTTMLAAKAYMSMQGVVMRLLWLLMFSI